MRTLRVDIVTDAVRRLCIETNCVMREDMRDALERSLAREESALGRQVLQQLIENARISRQNRMPICQDTGYAVFFVEIGQDVHVIGGSLEVAINTGVRAGYTEGYLRKSLVRSPIARINTGDNTPAVVYYEVVPGDAFRLTMLAKGAGCDNMSALRMFTPAEGLDAAKAFIVETVAAAGPNPSPPLVVGVGMGGTFERAALLAKKALTRPVGEPNSVPRLAEIERELLDEINALGIGPAGYGGRVTALAVHVEEFATHIASFPVAVNFDCHSHRCQVVEL